jgi:rhodanese-related sulfurtransferase
MVAEDHSAQGSAQRANRTCPIRESLLVAGIGIVLALIANAVSPRGISLLRDYFPGDTGVRPALTEVNATVKEKIGAQSDTPLAEDATTKRLKDKGLNVVSRTEVYQWFQDPRFSQQLIVFLDARNEDHYRQGHIPDAFLFDHYRSEHYLPTVLPVCQTAETIVIYCNGGDCEDSEFAAFQLRDAGVPVNKLQVYLGGFADWSTNSLPVELGEQSSGNFKPAPP